MADPKKRRPPRRHSWNRSQSDGFGPIKQVSYAGSVGMPMILVGVFMFAIASSANETLLWVLAAVLLGGGLLAAASGRIF